MTCEKAIQTLLSYVADTKPMNGDGYEDLAHKNASNSIKYLDNWIPRSK